MLQNLPEDEEGVGLGLVGFFLHITDCILPLAQRQSLRPMQCNVMYLLTSMVEEIWQPGSLLVTMTARGWESNQCAVRQKKSSHPCNKGNIPYTISFTLSQVITFTRTLVLANTCV